MFNQLMPLTVVSLCNLFCVSTLPIIRAFKQRKTLHSLILSLPLSKVVWLKANSRRRHRNLELCQDDYGNQALCAVWLEQCTPNRRYITSLLFLIKKIGAVLICPPSSLPPVIQFQQTGRFSRNVVCTPCLYRGQTNFVILCF